MDIVTWMEEIAAKLGEHPAVLEGKGVKIEKSASGLSISASAKRRAKTNQEAKRS